jgi:hypothetical protein
LDSVGSGQIGGMVPFNLGSAAFPGTGTFALLSHLRVFNNQMMISRVVNGELVPCVSGFISVDQPFTITNPSCKLSGRP